MAASEYTLMADDKIKDLVEVDEGGNTTKTTTVTTAGGTFTSTHDSIAAAAEKAKDHLNDSDITVTYDDATNVISAISYEKTVGP